MINYQKKENKYYYDKERLDALVKCLKNNKYDLDLIRKESVEQLLSHINKFLDSIEKKEEMVEATRHETEEEARDYFGEDFIQQFDSLLTKLDKEDTVVAIHGTDPSICPQILEQGLKYTSPSLGATTVSQTMNYGVEDMHYSDYEGLLNWGHKLYKGLVIIGIPYECFYKEGIWNHYDDRSLHGVLPYKINPDFIVGYIDVENKEIVLNPKYSREHDYEGLIEDENIFRNNPDIDNDKYRKFCAEFRKEGISYQNNNDGLTQNNKEELTLERFPWLIEPVVCNLASIELADEKAMSEERFKNIVSKLNYIKDVKKFLPEIESMEEMRKNLAMYSFDSIEASDNMNDFFIDEDAFDADLNNLENQNPENIKFR